MESQHTLRIKWFHIIFFIVLCFCIQTVFGCSCSCVNKQTKLWCQEVAPSWPADAGHITLHEGKENVLYHMLLSMSVNLFLISTWLLCFVFSFFFSRGILTFSSIKAKRAVNRMHCVVQMVIGGAFSESPHRDIKAMQIASLSLRAVCFCHKWVCDIGTPFYIKQIHQNDNGGTPSED